MEESLKTIIYITEAKVFNILFANSARTIFRNPVFDLFFGPTSARSYKIVVGNTWLVRQFSQKRLQEFF